jgi:hypothetical protein
MVDWDMADRVEQDRVEQDRAGRYIVEDRVEGDRLNREVGYQWEQGLTEMQSLGQCIREEVEMH